MTDYTGNVIKSYDYDIFGNEKNIDASDTNPFRYAGEYFDKETGDYYLRARYYDPGDGRFISQDTYEGDVKDPLSLNLYTYCEDDPVNGVDPSGHKPKNPLKKVSKIGTKVLNTVYKYAAKPVDRALTPILDTVYKYAAKPVDNVVTAAVTSGVKEVKNNLGASVFSHSIAGYSNIKANPDIMPKEAFIEGAAGKCGNPYTAAGAFAGEVANFGIGAIKGAYKEIEKEIKGK